MGEEAKRRALLTIRLGMAAEHSAARTPAPASKAELTDMAQRLEDYGIRPGTVAAIAIRRRAREG